MQIIRRLIQWFNRRRMEQDLAEELEMHRQLAERRLREAGLPPAEAAAASRRQIGNATLAREDARAIWISPWLDAVHQDIAYAFRILRRAPGFAAAMIAVMALGIGATTGVFGLLDGLVLRQLPVQAPDRLVYFSQPSFSYPVLVEVRARGADLFSSVAAWDMEGAYVAWNTELEPTEVMSASGNFYATLGVGAALGRVFGPEDDAPGGGREGLVAVISHSAWQRRFNSSPLIVGRPLRIDQDVFTIIGVTPPGFFGVAPGLAPEITVPLTTRSSAGALRSTTSSWVHLLARLHDHVSIRAANTAFRTLWPQVLEATTNPGMPADRRAVYLARTVSLESAAAGYSRVRNQFAEPLWLLLALVALLLGVACASAANLLLARGVTRQREIALRLAIGASRGRLVRQLLTESLVWTLLASVLGLMLAFWGGGALVALMTTSQEKIVLDLSPNWRILAFSISLALVTAAVCSVLPAFGVTRLDPHTKLKDTGQIGEPGLRRWSVGTTLVAAQVALTVLLLFGSSLFVRSLSRILAEDAGFDRRAVLVVATDPEAAGYSDDRIAAFYRQLHEHLAGIHGVQSASLSMYPPLSDEEGAWTQSIAIDGNPVPDGPGRSSVHFNTVSPGYFRTVGTELLRGRDFNEDDTASSPHVAIVNDTLARRYFPNQDALGRHIAMGRNENRRTLEIVGIVRDAKYRRLEEEALSIAYLPHVQHPAENLFAEIRVSGPLAPVVEGIRRAVRAVDPVVPMRIETVADRIRESLVTERVIATISTALGAAALFLACAALYGMLAYVVSRRTREIGVRLALGAGRFEVLRMVLAQSLVLAGIGITAGIIAALALGDLASNLLFKVSARDPLSLSAAALLMLVVATAAAFLPARRASRVDPVVALRCE